MTKWILLAALPLIACSNAPSPVTPETIMLTIRNGSKTMSFTPTALVERPDSSQIVVLQDGAYRKPMIYRAVPLAALLKPFPAPQNAILTTTAKGGFVTRIPLDRIMDADPIRAIAFIAIENPRKPWPALPHGEASAGPFHLVWLGADAHMISRDQWPSQIVHLETLPMPPDRRPAISPIKRLRRPILHLAAKAQPSPAALSANDP